MIKKAALAAVILCLVLAFWGCGSPGEEAEQLFRPDTVVNIPLNPETSEPAAETGAETLPVQTETAVEETAPEPTKAPSKSGSSKNVSGSASSSGGKTSTKATMPPETQPPATEPPETESPETEPPETESPEAAVYDIAGYTAGAMEYAVVEQINTYRTEAELEPLAMDGGLCGVAAVRAYEACVAWSHTRPNGTEWQTVLSDYGWGYSAAAEELSYASDYDAAAIVSRWMGAAGNSADLLNGAYTTIGVGIYDQNGTVILAAILIG